MSELKFKACRINDTAFVELFEDGKALCLVRRRIVKDKEKWNELYQEMCAEADRLNAIISRAQSPNEVTRKE